ncbi:MAG: radical SAM protein [Candidatus Omnitrophota bacterium]
MKNTPPPSYPEIVNSLWIRAGVIYFLSHVSILGSLGISALLGLSFHAAWIQMIDKAITFPAIIILMTWILTRIIEITSLESRTPRLDNFLKVMPQSIWVVLACTALPWLIHALIWITLQQKNIPIELISALLCPVMALWAADTLIRIKYSRLSNIREISLTTPTVLTGLALSALSVAVCLLSLKTQHPSYLSPVFSILSLQVFFLNFSFFTRKILCANPHIQNRFLFSKNLVTINPVGSTLPLSIFSIALRQPPPFATVIKSLTPVEYHVTEFNRLIWQNRYYEANAIVAISCFTSNCAEAYVLAREFKKRGAKVIIGGPHVTFFPDEALEFCDSVVIGPAESVWESIIHDYEHNTLKPVYQGDYCPKAQNKTYEYLLKAPVNISAEFLQASRGCKFHCYFCSIHAITRHHLPERSVEQIIALVKHISKERRAVSFIDNNLYIDPVYAKNLFRALIPLKIQWAGDVSIDITKDEEAMALLKKSGCHTLLIGFEITPFSKEAVQGGKYVYVDDYIKLARKIQKMGIRIKAHFIFGFPGDNWKTLAQIWLFCFKLSPTVTALSFLTPLPGSKFLDDAIKDESVINLNWSNYDIYQQVSTHPKMGQAFILKRCFIMIMFFFFLTTSRSGRIALLVLIIMECVFLFGS